MLGRNAIVKARTEANKSNWNETKLCVEFFSIIESRFDSNSNDNVGKRTIDEFNVFVSQIFASLAHFLCKIEFPIGNVVIWMGAATLYADNRHFSLFMCIYVHFNEIVVAIYVVYIHQYNVLIRFLELVNCTFSSHAFQ